MPSLKIIARFTDGRVLKGTTTNFNEAARDFVLILAGEGPPQAVAVEMRPLKALYFVRDFEGDASRKDDWSFRSNQPYAGRRIEVTFNDGEVIAGSTPDYNPAMPGFFVFPAGAQSNTIKVFALASGIKSIRWL
jgi:hypothetical protein